MKLHLIVIAASVATLAGCGGAADAGVFRSIDGGQSYVSSSLLDLESDFATDAVAALAVSPQASSTVAAGLEERGVIMSDDGGATWRSTVLQNGTPTSIAFHPTGTQVYLAYGSQVIVTADGGQTFDTLYSAPALVTSVAVDPAAPSTMYAGGAGGQLVRSTNGGASWNVVETFTSDIVELFISPLGSTVIVATSNDLFVSSDGATYVSRSPLLVNPRNRSTTVDVNAIAQSSQAGSPLVVVGPDGMFVSSDLGATWTSVNEPISSAAVPLIDVAVDPSNSSQVVIAGGSNVAKSNDGGQTWVARGIATGRTVGSLGIVDARTILVGVAGEGKSFIQRALGS